MNIRSLKNTSSPASSYSSDDEFDLHQYSSPKSPRSHCENKPLLTLTEPSTHLIHRDISRISFYDLPTDIWPCIFSFCSTPTLIRLCSVSKDMLKTINEIKSFEQAKLITQNLLETNQISPFNQFLCTNAHVLNQEHFDEIEHLNQIIHRPLQDILIELPDDSDPNNTETPITKVISRKANTLKCGLLVFFFTSFITLVTYLSIFSRTNWHIELKPENAVPIVLLCFVTPSPLISLSFLYMACIRN